MYRFTALAGAACLSAVCFAASLSAQEPAAMDVEFVGPDGSSHGTATLTQTEQGVLIAAELTGLPEGPHGFHFHEFGVCDAPFESAGGHLNPKQAAHGVLVAEGPHSGDMPNIHVPGSGQLTAEVLNTMVSLESGADGTLLDSDGSALIIHSDADDYSSQPSGEAGDRIACAVVGP